MTNVHRIKTKLVCQVCVNNYGSEEHMLGRCHGLPLVEVPWTKEDYKNERNRQEASKLNW